MGVQASLEADGFNREKLFIQVIVLDFRLTESTSTKRTENMATTPTYDELQVQIKKLTEQAQAVRAAEIEAVVTEMKAKIDKYGLTASQLGFSATAKRAPKTSSPAKEPVVMYKNKEGLTWSGAARGRKPKWVVEAQARNEDLEKFRVK